MYIGKQYKYEIVVLRLISFCFFFNNSLHFHFANVKTYIFYNTALYNTNKILVIKLIKSHL